MRVGTELGEPSEVLWLVHHHPGRLRVRAEVFRGGEDVAGRVRTALAEEAGVVASAHNPLTGSVLIEYEPERTDVESLLALVTDVAGLKLVVEASDARGPTPAQRVEELGQKLDGIARELTGGRATLRELVSAALAATSVVSFIADPKRRLPRWDNALYWAYQIFREGRGARADEA